ncbi:MAG TPA: 3-oxoacyl-ACP reductase family protein [Pyrinomonadaceae bacterium]|nr:3-oxoacyl-ACP reductase family protein [Pyrinomonadaceae bacterium]
METESFQLRGRVALVSGGSRGIGRAVVDRLAEAGVAVVVNYRLDKAAAAAAVTSAEAKGVKGLAVQADVSDLSDATRLVAETINHFQRLDFLICNAGIWEGAPVEEMPEALWDKTMNVNLRGTWTLCRAAVPVMKRQRFGRIVIVASTAGQRGEAHYSNYAASKGGQISFTKSLASELGQFGINVNAVAPGWVDTDMTTDALAAEGRDAVAGSIPVGAIATADDIARPIVFLCSDWARHINGEILNVNGGSVLCG